MRKAKFRAWDSEADIMVYSDHRTRKLYDVYYGFEMNENGSLECRWEGDFSESHVLDGGTLDNIMQFTGLKDKNGKEIYEGDVLRDSESIVIVKFVDGEFSVDYRTMGGKWRNYGSLFDYLGDYEGEVIGNIHDNPDLLEVNQ